MSEHEYLTGEEGLRAEALCNEAWAGNVAYRFKLDLDAVFAELEAAREENKRLRKALEFYADDKSHVNRYGNWSCNGNTPVNVDKGEIAKCALNPQPAQPEKA